MIAFRGQLRRVPRLDCPTVPSSRDLSRFRSASQNALLIRSGPPQIEIVPTEADIYEDPKSDDGSRENSELLHVENA